jgi:PLP dependent protein
MTNSIENLELAKQKIRLAFKKYILPESTKSPEIIVVTKTVSADRIIPLLEHGHRKFGENRVQEAMEKWPDLKKKYPDIELHLIGPLQSNKAEDACGIFDYIQTIDRPKIAEAISKIKPEIPCLIQVNTGHESQKAGVMPEDTDHFTSQAKNILNIKGLMCIPPVKDKAQFHFLMLKKIAERNGLTITSMGMSHDFELAACIGASFVRIGSAIFGERNAN